MRRAKSAPAEEEFFKKNFLSARIWRPQEIFEYLDGYILQSPLSLNVFDDAFDYIRRNTMSEKQEIGGYG